MGVFGMGIGDAHMGRRQLDKDGNVVKETPAHWEPNPDGGCVAIWPIDQETMQVNGVMELFGDWDAAGYLKRALELLHPTRKINVPDLAAMVRVAAKNGADICDYCQDCNCRDCIVNEWKGDIDDE